MVHIKGGMLPEVSDLTGKVGCFGLNTSDYLIMAEQYEDDDRSDELGLRLARSFIL
jgi:hypothetical protein